MCGISGFIDPRLNATEAGDTLSRMLERIAHRGPDARSTWKANEVNLGHNRLSIIDLSADGNQPMEYFESVIVFNGEIYNYIEVRETLIKKGYQFKTQSDTEVILAAYREYGTDCVNHLVGMWAFALWDKKTEQLFCSRDRFGIKPFYYLHQGESFYFGSEYKALKESPLFSNELNLNQVSRGLQLGWVCYHDETYFKTLKALPAAHNLIFKRGKLTVTRYWDIDFNKKFTGSFEEAKELFREMFFDSIRLHMRSDVEVGGCLSGGLDSSAIASVIGTEFSKTKFKTFSIYYEGKDDVDERPFVKEVTNKYSNLEPYYFSPQEKDIEESFHRMVYHADIPVTGSSPMSQYFLMRLAAEKKVKVILDGQGADEYLGGYMHSFYRLIGSQLLSFQLLKAHREFYAHGDMQEFSVSKMSDVFLKSVMTGLMSEQQLYSTEFKSYYPFASKEKNHGFRLPRKKTSRLNSFFYHLMQTTSLPTLLQFEDRNSMAFSIESRVPFLDHRLVEFVFSLPDEMKIHLGITKRIQRAALEGVLPKAIAARKDKKGFVTPGEVKWLKGPLKFLMAQNMSSSNMLNGNVLNTVIKEFENGNVKHANLVWRAAVYTYWEKHFAS